jgi:LacI family transcriptional regulator
VTARRPTLTQVAAAAGVSLKTASRALNNEPNVAPDTAVRVRSAADRLGYRLNGIARELRRGATSTLIGLISGDLANPFYSAVASGIERELRQHHLQLLTANNDEDPDRERDLVEALLQRRVRALLVIPTDGYHTHLSADRAAGVPIVFLDRPPVGVPADAVLIDNVGGGRSAGAHLLAAGHRRIAVISDLSRLPPQRDRLDGFVHAMRAAGNTGWETYLRSDVHDTARAQEAVDELLRLDEPPTALFTTNNRLTTGALRALKGRQRSVALIGFDDFDLADVVGVSVVAHDAAEMGRRAARLAIDRIAGLSGPPRTVLMPTWLIERGSSDGTPW